MADCKRLPTVSDLYAHARRMVKLDRADYNELAAAVWACPVNELSSAHASTVAEAVRLRAEVAESREFIRLDYDKRGIRLAQVSNKATRRGKILREAAVQPNQGWGDLCATCKYTFPPERKYATFHPDWPCSKVKHAYGGNLYGPDLTAWNNGSETCSDYESATETPE